MHRPLLSLLLSSCAWSGSASVSLQPTVRMDRWDVSAIRMGLRGARQGICPREPVQLALVADAVHRKRGKAKTIETWAGPPRRAKRFGTMGFEEFAFTLHGGTLDPHTGWFTPDPDMLATAASGFTIEARYKREPDVQPVRMRVAPVYDCVAQHVVAGAPGPMGPGGTFGTAGTNGTTGSDTAAGGDGGHGTDGGAGGLGGNGGAGPQLRVWATLVRTPIHPALVLVKIEAADGSVGDTILFEPQRTFTVAALGGPGGAGGPGGPGGAGGTGGAGHPGGRGGTGGAGGSGGDGGSGGPGGTIHVVVDASTPELAQRILVDVSGGAPGSPGFGGAGGSAGAGGMAQGEGASAGAVGTAGSAGAHGRQGMAGSPGVATVEVGDVSAVFAGLPGGIERR